MGSSINPKDHAFLNSKPSTVLNKSDCFCSINLILAKLVSSIFLNSISNCFLASFNLFQFSLPKYSSSLPLIFLPLTFIIIDAYPVTILKICLIYLSFFTLASVISFVFSKNEFGYILNLLNTMYPDLMQKIELEYSEKRRSKLKSLPVKLILQFSPLVLVSLIFISLVGYVQASKKTGDIYYNSYLINIQTWIQ